MYLKCKPPSHHILVVRWNVEGGEHGLPDFHAPTKESLTLQVIVTKGFEDRF
jgi:hypothetical protein